jgi:hypothetical protein
MKLATLIYLGRVGSGKKQWNVLFQKGKRQTPPVHNQGKNKYEV